MPRPASINRRPAIPFWRGRSTICKRAPQDAHLIAYPGLATGSISAQERSSFLGAGIRATKNLTYFSPAPNQQHRLDFLYGFRYLRLAENLTVSDSILTSTTIPPGTTFTANDLFRTTNNFYGADFGLTGEAQLSRWSFIGVGRVALRLDFATRNDLGK